MKAIRRDDTIFIALPKAARKVIPYGCNCYYCKAHPDQNPTWDTIAVAADVVNAHAFTVHYPEFANAH